MNTHPDQVQAIYLQAAKIGDPAERAALVDRACGDDAELRERVLALFAASAAQGAPPQGPQHDGPPPFDKTIAQLIPEAAPGAMIANRYKLLEPIGEGGMGLVWMAEQRTPVRRLVALKLIKAGMDSRAVLARFEAERQALAMMDHPSIARVLDGGVTDRGHPWFAMELVRGLPLTEYCDQRRLSIPDRLELFMQICSAAQHAHQKGIIHRDLKPTNVLVTELDGRPLPKIIDFGLAKALGGGAVLTDRTLYTAYGAAAGTPLYMAPEQVAINALDVDTRADVYALGVILYELLTGTTPIERQRLKDAAWDEMRRVIREEDPPLPSSRISRSDALPSLAAMRHIEPGRLPGLVKGDLDWIVMKALDKDRNRRYESAASFSADVQRHLANELVEAAPPSLGYRTHKFLSKHRGPVVAATLVIAALTSGLIGTAYMAIRAREAGAREKQRAESESQARAVADLESYVAHLLAAKTALTAKLFPEARQRLNECPPHLRGWEWRFLEQSASCVDRKLAASINDLHLSPDGTRMLVLRANQSLDLCDMTGRSLASPLNVGGPAFLESSWKFCQFSADGRRFLTIDNKDHVATIWNLDGQQIGQAFNLGADPFFAKLNHDGTRVLTADHRGAQWWDDKGRKLGPLMGDGSNELHRVALHGDGDLAVTVTTAGKMQFWDNGGNARGNAVNVAADCSGVEFSPLGTHVYIVSHDDVQFWNLLGERVGQPIRGSNLKLSANGKKYLIDQNNGDCRLGNAPGQPADPPVSIRLPEDEKRVDCALSSDGETVLAWSNETVYAWNANGQPIGAPIKGRFATFRNPLRPTFSPSFTPDGSKFLVMSPTAAGDDYYFAQVAGDLLLMNVDGTLLGAVPGVSWFYSAVFTSDGRHVMVVADNGEWLILPTHGDFGAPLEVLNDGAGRDWIVEAAKAESIAPTSAARHVAHDDTGLGPHTVRAMSHDGSRLVVPGNENDQSVRFWDVAARREIAAFPTTSDIKHLEFTPDDTRLVVTLANGTTEIWDSRPYAQRQQTRVERVARLDQSQRWAESYVDALFADADHSADPAKAIDDDATLTALQRQSAKLVLPRVYARVQQAKRRLAEKQRDNPHVAEELRRAVDAALALPMEAAIDAENATELQARLGQPVKIRGTVASAQPTVAGDAVNLLLSPDDSECLVWLPPPAKKTLDALFLQDTGERLAGELVVAAGVLEPYGGSSIRWRNWKQLTINHPSQLQILNGAGDKVHWSFDSRQTLQETDAARAEQIDAQLHRMANSTEDRHADDLPSIPGWGVVLDAIGDCEIQAEDDRLRMTVPAGARDLNHLFGGMTAPRVLRPVDGDFVIEAKVSGEFTIRRDASKPGETWFRGGGLILWQNWKTYLRLERNIYWNGQEHAAATAVSEYSLDGEFHRNESSDPQGADPNENPAAWLKIVRRGDTLMTAYSSDGELWSRENELELALNDRLWIGCFAINVAPWPLTVQFDDVRVESPAR